MGRVGIGLDVSQIASKFQKVGLPSPIPIPVCQKVGLPCPIPIPICQKVGMAIPILVEILPPSRYLAHSCWQLLLRDYRTTQYLSQCYFVSLFNSDKVIISFVLVTLRGDTQPEMDISTTYIHLSAASIYKPIPATPRVPKQTPIKMLFLLNVA